MAAVRALTAPARVTCNARMASTIPPPILGIALARPDSTASAAA